MDILGEDAGKEVRDRPSATGQLTVDTNAAQTGGCKVQGLDISRWPEGGQL